MPNNYRSITFTIEGESNIVVDVTEIAGQLVFDLRVIGDDDLRGLFFDFRNTNTIDNLEVSGSDVSDRAFKNEGVTNLGQGVNLKGTKSKFDVGVAFGTPGKGKDKISQTSFTLSTIDGTALTLDDLALVEFGARLTSGGSKLTTIAPAAPDANDDAIVTNEDTATDETAPNYNLLANDTDADSSVLTVVAVNSDASQVGKEFMLATGGLLQVNSDGTFDFNPNGKYEDLAVGETRTDSFTYRITDELNDPNNQGFDTATATITVAGVNDAPVISLEAGDSNAKTVIETNAGLSTAATLTVSDVDTTDLVTASVLSVTTSGKDDDVATPDNATLLSYYTLASSNILYGTEVSNTLSYTFNSAGEAFDYLAADEELVLNYTLEARDDNGASDTETIAITIDGTNDAPIARALSFTIGEDDPSVNQSFIASDVDTTDNLSYQILSQPVDRFGNQYGSVTNNNDGTFTFDSLDNFQFLNDGESWDVTFQYIAIDDSGTNNAASEPKTVTVRVDGADDPPIEVIEPGFFHTTNQSIWDTGSAVVIQPIIPFIGVQWNKSGSTTLINKKVLIPKVKDPVTGTVITPEVSTPKVSFTGSSKGKVGLQPYFSLTSGDIDAELPIEFSLFLEQQQVSAGRAVTLQSGFTLKDGAFFQTFSPNIELGLDLIFDLETSAAFQVGSKSYNIFDSLNINKTQELLSFSADDLSLEVEFGDFGSLEGGLPVINTEGSKQDEDTLSSYGRDKILTANLDLDGITTTLAGVPSLEGSFGQNIGVGKIEADYNLIDVDLIGSLNLNQTFNLDIDDFIGNIYIENGDVFSFILGQDLTFTVANDFDVNNNGVLDFTTNLDLNASLLNKTNLGFDLDLAMETLSASLGINFDGYINDAGIKDIEVSFGPVFEDELSIFSTNNLASVYQNDFSLAGFDREQFNVGEGNTDPFSWWSQANLWLEDGTISTNEWQDYNPDSLTYVITHGFTDSVIELDNGTNGFQDLASAIHDYSTEPVNVILWEWSNRAGSSPIDYLTVASNVIDVGYDLAAFLVDIEANPDTTNLIGHSLGAHVMGNAGDTYNLITGNSVATLVGMDPAGPGFETGESYLDAATYRLDATDAQRAVALHTSNILGYDDSLADLDLFVNWSDALQPGQSDFTDNHNYAVQLLEELFEGASFAQGSGNPQEDSTTLIGNNLEIADIYAASTVGSDYVQTRIV